MGVFHVFQIVQMVPNCATHHISFMLYIEASWGAHFCIMSSITSVEKFKKIIQVSFVKTILWCCSYIPFQMITLGGDAELELVDSLDPFSEGIVFRLVATSFIACLPNIYLFKVNNRSTRKRCEICSKLTIFWHRSVVFLVNFDHISRFFSVFLLL